MEQIEIQQDKGQSPDTTILRINGPLTLGTLFHFQSALRNPELKNLIVDLTGTPYMDSAGLGAILGQWAHCQRHGSRFALTGVPDRIMTLLDITKTRDVIPQHKTVEDADKAFA